MNGAVHIEIDSHENYLHHSFSKIQPVEQCSEKLIEPVQVGNQLNFN